MQISFVQLLSLQTCSSQQVRNLQYQYYLVLSATNAVNDNRMMVSTVVEDMDTAEEEEERKITPVKRVRQNMSRDY